MQCLTTTYMLLRIAIGKYFENFTTKVTINNFESKKKACSQVKWNTLRFTTGWKNLWVFRSKITYVSVLFTAF